MPATEADRLGPKGHVYVELVREQWRAPLERGTARRALLTSALGVALILFGLIGAFVVYGESVVLIGIGAFAFYSSLGEIRALLPEFREARRIGWVEPSLDDSIVAIGDPATFSVVLHARRAQVIREATLVAEARRWERSTPGEILVCLPLPVPLTSGTGVAAGDDWRQTVTFRIPDSAPPSFYDAMESVRWSLTLELHFADAPVWKRSWPMLVYPPDAG